MKGLPVESAYAVLTLCVREIPCLADESREDLLEPIWAVAEGFAEKLESEGSRDEHLATAKKISELASGY
jgi:hypothetical protein